ncbi:MAG: hypothetical protein LBP95_00560 [Deltaproteobacteria bacterium]|jgi:hypothetical protein|nr:hypothetical protein [Deltaproteobacteria bacterium]
MAGNLGLTKKQAASLAELEKLAKKLGLRVFFGKLVFAGIKLKGGNCLLREDSWVVVDRYQPYEDQAEVFRKALAGLEIDPATAAACSAEVRAVIGLSGGPASGSGRVSGSASGSASGAGSGGRTSEEEAEDAGAGFSDAADEAFSDAFGDPSDRDAPAAGKAGRARVAGGRGKKTPARVPAVE